MIFNKNMLAYCGLYCEQCSFKVAYDTQDMKHLEHYPKSDEWSQKVLRECNCDGCKSDNCLCGDCTMQPCAVGKNLDTCADCDSFPCEYIDEFANDGIPHHKEAIENLHYIRKHGVEAWFEILQSKLNCKCGERQSWYYSCPVHSNV